MPVRSDSRVKESKNQSYKELIAKGRQKNEEPLRLRIARHLPVPQEEITFFLAQLSQMNSAGISYGRGLSVLVEQTHNLYFQEALGNIRNLLYQGFALSSAMSQYPGIFSAKIIAMIRCGERTGDMARILNKAAETKEKELRLIRNIKQKATYPVMILFSMLLFVMLMSGVMLNIVFKALHMDFKDIPQLTKMMLIFYTVITHPILVAIIFIAVPAFLYYVKKNDLTEKMLGRLDTLFLLTPLLGPVVHKISLARFCDSLSDLLNSGISLPKAIDLAAKSSGNRVCMKDYSELGKRIIARGCLSEAMEGLKVFPRGTILWVQTGEETGATGDMLSKAARFMQQDVDFALNTFYATLEPILITVIGIITGLMVIATLLPISKMIETGM